MAQAGPDNIIELEVPIIGRDAVRRHWERYRDSQLANALADRAKVRRRMEKAVEALLEALDAMDGDPDFEPALGSPEVGPGRRRRTAGTLDQRLWSIGDPSAAAAEREDVSEDEGGQVDAEQDDADSEPWLGATEGPTGSARWISNDRDLLDGEIDRQPAEAL